MTERSQDNDGYDSEFDERSSSAVPKPHGGLPILQAPEGFIPFVDRGESDLDEGDDGIPPEVKAVKNRAGCYMFFLGTLFVFGLVLLSDFGGKLTKWFATKRESPPGYQQLRDQPGIHFPPAVLEHLARSLPTPLNREAIVDGSGYPAALLSFLVEMIEAARVADASQTAEPLQSFVSTERFLEEVETSGQGPDIDSSNRQYWRNWAKNSTFHFEFGATNEILGFDWLVDERDGLATILTHGDEEMRSEVVLAYVHQADGKWAIYDLRYASEYMSDVHFRARAAMCEPFEVENLNVLYDRLQRLAEEESDRATLQVKLQYAFEVLHFPRSIRPEAERFYTWHLYELHFFEELNQFLTPDRTEQSLAMTEIAAASAYEVGDIERANGVLRQSLPQVSWHPIFAQAQNISEAIGVERALPLLRRGAMLMPDDLSVIRNYCALLAQLEMSEEDFGVEAEFETLSLRLDQCADGAARAVVLAESISQVAADWTQEFKAAVGQRLD